MNTAKPKSGELGGALLLIYAEIPVVSLRQLGCVHYLCNIKLDLAFGPADGTPCYGDIPHPVESINFAGTHLDIRLRNLAEQNLICRVAYV